MPLLLILFLPVLEIYTLFQASHAWGFGRVLLLLFAGALIGINIMRMQGFMLLQNLQMQARSGKSPAKAALHSALIFLGGFLLMLPGFISDVIGLVFLLPGTRHLLVLLGQVCFVRMLQKGQFRFYRAQGFGRGTEAPTHSTQMRDVTPQVIDVTPLSKSQTTQDE